MKKLIALTLAVISVITFSSCKNLGQGQVIESIDTGKTQIYVEVFDGGYGKEWVQKVANDFNATYPNYQVVVYGATTDYSVIYEAIKGGYGTTDIYFTCEPLYTKEMIDRNLLTDLTDVYNSHIDGENKPSIKEKTVNYEIYEDIWSDDNGIYALPYGDSVNGIVFDYDYFVNSGYIKSVSATDTQTLEALTAQGITYKTVGQKVFFESSENSVNYEEGDVITSAGKDGKFGTYDDGQPQNIAEWDDMLKRIVAKGDKAFIWSGEFASIYTLPMITSVFAQYDGIDNFNLFYSFDGTYSRTSEKITAETGYKVYEMEGLEYSMNFFDTYLNDNKYKHSAAIGTGVGKSHTDAQNNFILGYTTNSCPTMLFDGVWWEHEAKGTFDMLESRGETDKKYGVTDYRFMMLPKFEGQIGIDGNGNGSVLTATDTGNVYMVKRNEDAETIKMKKEFIAWTCKDEYLRYFTKTTSSFRPFVYELSDAEKAEMTVFGRNAWEMYSDRDNIAVVRPLLNYYFSNIYNYGGKRDFFNAKIGQQTISSPIQMHDQGYSVDEYVAGMKKYYKDAWNSYLDSL